METIAVIGLGRVGIPLFLFLERLGFQVIGVDIDEAVIDCLTRRQMPFSEEGCDELLRRSQVTLTSNLSEAAKAQSFIITVGTPLLPHIETDLSGVQRVVNELLSIIQKGHNLILRSTVAPETTQYIKKYIESKSNLKVGRDVALSFCPERLAENHALKELELLPQIIGVEDELSFKMAEAVFGRFGVNLMKTSYISAELVKLFNNNARYVDFAVANQFAIIANNYQQNIYKIIDMCNANYPRGQISSPGLTGGTCLRKDFGMVNERSPGTDILLSAWKVNEYMPYHLVDNLLTYCDILDKDVAVLGYTFKRNSDDVRDTLVPKLIRYIERQVPRSITICEPHLDDASIQGYPNAPLSDALEQADIIFIAMNHEQFSDAEWLLKASKKGAWVVDIWNCLGRDKILIHNG